MISDFSNGGTTSTITVYKWDPTCKKTTGDKKGDCGDANLRILATSQEANCANEKLGAGDEFCAIVNPKTTKSPWSFEDKSGSKEFLNGEFFEGGINLSLLGLGSECFGSVASETRASTSTTSTLQDFVLSNFAECKSETTTTPVSEGKAIPEAGLNIPTDPADASLKVQDKAEIAVTGATSFSGTLSFHLCGPFEASSETLCEEGGVDHRLAKSQSERNVRLRLGDGDVGRPLLLAGGFLGRLHERGARIQRHQRERVLHRQPGDTGNPHPGGRGRWTSVNPSPIRRR